MLVEEAIPAFPLTLLNVVRSTMKVMKILWRPISVCSVYNVDFHDLVEQHEDVAGET